MSAQDTALKTIEKHDDALLESEKLEKLRTQLQKLRFEVDVLKETIAVLKRPRHRSDGTQKP